MRRLFWVGVGVAVTVVVYRRGRRLVRQYVPATLAQRAEHAATEAGRRAGDVAQEFRARFTEARAAREAELLEALLAEGQADPAQTRARRATGARGATAAGGPATDDDEDALGYSF
jgi:hypothetical protein